MVPVRLSSFVLQGRGGRRTPLQPPSILSPVASVFKLLIDGTNVLWNRGYIW